MTTKKTNELTLKDRLSRLTYRQAIRLLGEEGNALSRRGGKYDIRLDEQVSFGGDLFCFDFGHARVTISQSPSRTQKLDLRCSSCDTPCEHLGAARREGAPEETPVPGTDLQDRSFLQGVHHHQRGIDRPEPAGRRHGDQRRSSARWGRDSKWGAEGRGLRRMIERSGTGRKRRIRFSTRTTLYY